MSTNQNAWKCPECDMGVTASNELEAHWVNKHSRKTTRLRQMLNSDKMIVAPFCMNAFHAKIAEMVGLDAIYMTGHGTSAERGYSDVGLITQTEMLQNASYITKAVDIPVICDADTGYGNPINVWRTVREYEALGVGAIHIEDQVFPKKCGFFAGKMVVSTEEHTQKIYAAVDARRDKDFVIIARTDALAINGWPDTIKRCKAYHAAGADVIFVDGIRTVEDLKIYAQELRDIPKLYNGMLIPTNEVAKLGYKIMITGGTMAVVFDAVLQAFKELKENGIVSNVDHHASREEFSIMLGLQEIYDMEQRYQTKTIQDTTEVTA